MTLSPADSPHQTAALHVSYLARKINKKAIVIDTHADTVGRILDEGVDISKRTKNGHIDIPRLKEGGIDVQFFSCWIDPKYIKTKGCIKRTLDMIDAIKNMVAKNPKHIALSKSASDIIKINKQGKIAAVLCIEGGHAIEDDLATLRLFYELGVRYMTLTWMNNNNWADGSGDKPKHNGLTSFGREVVREMNRIGMIVDISHVSEKTFWDVMKVVRKPVIASHSCCKAICNHHRNLTDRQIKAVAKNGGVICVNFFSTFISDKFRIKGNINRPTIDNVIDHIEHLIAVGGIDNIGIGSDFDGVSHLPIGLEDCTKMPSITEKLLERGYSGKDVMKVLGGNTLRVIREVVGN